MSSTRVFISQINITMSNNQLRRNIPQAQEHPITDGSQPREDVDRVIQKCGPIDESIKVNPERLRRLQESSRADTNISSSSRFKGNSSSPAPSQNPVAEPHKASTASVASSATFYTPSKASLSATTLQGSSGFKSTDEAATRTFKTGHGVCCNEELVKRCLECSSNDEDLDPTGTLARLAEATDSSEVDKVISGYTGPTQIPEPATEEGREAAAARRKARLARIE